MDAVLQLSCMSRVTPLHMSFFLPLPPSQSAKAERKAIALAKELAKLQEQSQVSQCAWVCTARLMQVVPCSLGAALSSCRCFKRSEAASKATEVTVESLPLQVPAGARLLLRLPGLLRFALLGWLVYQSSEWRSLACGMCLELVGCPHCVQQASQLLPPCAWYRFSSCAC